MGEKLIWSLPSHNSSRGKGYDVTLTKCNVAEGRRQKMSITIRNEMYELILDGKEEYRIKISYPAKGRMYFMQDDKGATLTSYKTPKTRYFANHDEKLINILEQRYDALDRNYDLQYDKSLGLYYIQLPEQKGE